MPAAQPPRARPRDENINIRVAPDAKATIDRAAALAGKSRSEFMLDAARREAEAALLDQRLFQLDAHAYKAFVAALDKPADAAAMRRLAKTLKAKPPWER